MERKIESFAKVNLFLKITGKRDDGYHELCSLFQRVTLADILTFKTDDTGVIRLSCDNDKIPTDEGNLVMQAALALQNETGGKAGVDIDLRKKIPVGAGLGGGSSNAATTLTTLNDIWGLNLPKDRLSDIALKLGADVPFFLGSPMALVEGIGERLSPLSPAVPCPMLLINPGFHISAGDAYKNSTFDFKPVMEPEKVIEAMTSGEPAKIAIAMQNDLAPWAMEAYPALATLKRTVETSLPKPLTVGMTGSGPTLMALYETEEQLLKAEDALEGVAPFIEKVYTLV